MRWSLFSEILAMSWDTVRGNKMRSFLTVLGIVIGITSIVGMTALIRGFDQSIRDLIRRSARTRSTSRSSRPSASSSGADFQELIMRPNITPDDAEAIEREAPSIEVVDMTLGGGGPAASRSAVYYGNQRTKQMAVIGTTEQLAVRRPARRSSRAGSSPRGEVAAAQARRRARPDAGRGAVSRTSTRSARPCASGSSEYEVDRRDGASGPAPAASTSAPTTSSSSRDDLREAVRHPR